MHEAINSLLTPPECWFIFFTFVFMALDVVAGNIKGFVTKKWNSSNGWEGIKKKTALVLVVILGIVCHLAQSSIDLGIHIPLLVAICTYIMFVEILSVVENVCEIDPKLKNSKFLSFFDFAREGIIEDEEVVVNHAA